MRRFETKNVIVTGAAMGLGKSLAEQFAAEGARLVVLDRQDPAAAVQDLRRLGATADGLSCDIAVEKDVTKAVADAAQLLDGKIDILINNAGFNGKAQLLQDMKLEDWDYTLRVNLTGTMLVTREVSHHMIARKSGRIINIASNVARRGLPFRADYVSSKWALIGLTQTLALELVEHGIRVNAVCPGPIEGERIGQLVRMHSEAEGVDLAAVHKAWEDVPMKRFIRPEEVANVVKFLCGEESSAMTGQALNITGGMIMT
ncbi:SDR family NAD(P)-dependent oxidoreductase [Crateriforma conspicua]|uniref:3-oxoacyl-[acyl-carrier-protein] reductase FabG n=1 Tax=Crateriforma conspicua TaxID=2527996 RepID=A0A5C5Y0X1_9PLAN|nr:SDR family NAD(P)-dependent oxidoreductase [Crateriforma conspicua]TWT68854.1 3-oxoacyl-[acyl-carrier-protein] reductase FabG [Crateriforma conspicua]